MTRLRRVTGQTLRSLRVRNYRMYFIGQLVSTTGTWMQTIAQNWLVLKITGSGIAIGVTTALQFTPIMLAGAWSGVIADRVDKRKLLIGTQTAAGLLALVLGLVTAAGAVQLWIIYLLAFLLGCVTALDNPARRAFVVEMVGLEDVTNAVSLSSAMFTTARIIGPAIAGIVIATAGMAWCFYANAASYLAAIAAFAAMRPTELFPVERAPRKRGQLRAGLRYAWGHPVLRLALLMTAVIGTLAYNFQVVLPLVAKQTFHGDASAFATLYSLMSVGAVIGALFTAHQARATRRFLVAAAAVFGILMLLAAGAPTLAFELLVLVPVGAASVAFVSMANSVLHTHTDDTMRGRVMALYSVAFLGSTPIGGPIVGWVCEALGARAGLALGGIAALATALAAVAVLRRHGHPAAEAPGEPVTAVA